MLFSRRKGRLAQKWVFDTKSDILAGPAVYDVDKDGRREIVLGTKDGRVMMLDDNSNVKWVHDINENVNEMEQYFQDQETANSIRAPPSISDINKDGRNEVVFGTESGSIYALNSNGEMTWQFKAPAAVRSSILLHDIDRDGNLEVIFGCMDGNLYILNSKGKQIWIYEGHSPIQSMPAVLPGTNELVFGCDDGTVKCIAAMQEPIGGALWVFRTDGKIMAQPAIADLYNDNRVQIIVGSADYRLYVLAEDGELIWKYRTEGALVSKAVAKDINGDGKKEIVFGSCDNNVYALTRDGDKIWSYETYFWIAAPPIVEDIDGDGRQEVIAGSYDHNIYVLDTEGSYNLDYVPGLGGVVHQAGHYGEVMTSEPGRVEGKKLWQFRTGGFIVGFGTDFSQKSIIINIKEGQVSDIMHQK